MKVLVMQPKGFQHGNEAQFESYALGTLSEEQASQLEEHLLICAICRQELEKAEDYVIAVREAGKLLAEQPEPQTSALERASKRWGFPQWAPILAAAAIVLLIAAGWQFLGPGGAPPLAVRLVTTRGASGAAQAAAGRPLQLQPDLEGLAVSPSDQLEIAGHTGKIVWTGALHATVLVPAMRSGLYFVRVRRNTGELLREYALEIEAR